MFRLKWLIVLVVVMTVAAGCGPKSTAVSAQRRVTSKVKVAVAKLKVTPSDLKTLTPRGYTIKKWVSADINGDQKQELVFVAEPSKIEWGGSNNPPARLLIYAKKEKSWQKLWQFSGNMDYAVGRGSQAPQEPVLEVGDINKDGFCEIVFSFCSYGASDAGVSTHIYSCRQNQFVDLIGNKLGHTLDAGVILADQNICFYQSDWAGNESHWEPHRYKVEIYRWNDEKYVSAKKFLTLSKGEVGEKEAKQDFQAFLQGKPIIAANPVVIEAERIRASFYHDAVDEKIKKDLKRQWQRGAKAPKIIIPQHDLNRVKDYNADKRVIELMVKFCNEEKHQWAARINAGYEDYTHSITRETYYGSNEFANQSAHYTAQALDIFYADGVEIAWQVSSDPVKRKKAQAKIREIMTAIFALARNNRFLLPTQIMVYEQADVNYFAADIAHFYDPNSNMGMWSNERMWDRIHIGY